MIDVISVIYDEETYVDSIMLEESLSTFEPDRCHLYAVDNREGTEEKAWVAIKAAKLGTSPIIGFIHPGVTVYGEFIDDVMIALAEPGIRVVECDMDESTAVFIKRDWFIQFGMTSSVKSTKKVELNMQHVGEI